MAKVRHLHKFVLKVMSGGEERGPDWSKPSPGKYLIYACALPNCTSYLAAPLAIGKETMCWVCGERCLIPPRDNKGKYRVRPHCEGCTRVYPGTKRARQRETGVDKVKDMSLEELLVDVDVDDLFGGE